MSKIDKETLEVIQRAHELFRREGLTLAVAESCTGGLISHYITYIPGASTFFEAGIVIYSSKSKKVILGVASKTVLSHGVVSEEIAREIAEKVRDLLEVDFSLSTTGNLGPDTLEGKEMGLVYIAVSTKEQTLSKEMKFIGGRKENKEKAALAALRLLVEVVEMMG